MSASNVTTLSIRLFINKRRLRLYDDESVACGVGRDKLVLGDYLVVAFGAYIIYMVCGRVDANLLHNCVECAILRLAVGGREGRVEYAECTLTAVGLAVMIAVEDGTGAIAEGDSEGVVGLLGGEGYVVAVDVGPGEPQDVG